MIDYPRLDLLGRHVGDGADDDPGLREAERRLVLSRTVGLFHRSRETEVEHLDYAICSVLLRDYQFWTGVTDFSAAAQDSRWLTRRGSLRRRDPDPYSTHSVCG